MQTTYPLKIQAMRSQGKQPRFYVSFPLALAAALGLEGGETVQWKLLDRGELHLVRPDAQLPTTPPARLPNALITRIFPPPRLSATVLRPGLPIATPRPHCALCFWDKLYNTPR